MYCKKCHKLVTNEFVITYNCNCNFHDNCIDNKDLTHCLNCNTKIKSYKLTYEKFSPERLPDEKKIILKFD